VDWQSLVAIGVAIACGFWAAWKFVSPFFKQSAGCTSCTARRDASQQSLLNIEEPPSA